MFGVFIGKKKINNSDKKPVVASSKIVNEFAKYLSCATVFNGGNYNDLNDILNGLISDNTPLLIEKEFIKNRS